MSSVYFQLAALAVVFTGFGFLLHAFYFGGNRRSRLTGELERFREEVNLKESELLQAEEEAAKAGRIIQSQEKQLQQKAAEMDRLRQLASRQDKAIELLQKDAEAIRRAITGSPASSKSIEDALSSIAPAFSEQLNAPISNPPAPVHIVEKSARTVADEPDTRPEQPAQDSTPSWKENLDNIISILDTMEKEVDK